MYYSLFEIFAVGIGPSSSHTVGPMKAACRYVGNLREQGLLAQTAAVKTELYGSLALTGRGHGTLNAVVYGLLGLKAEEVDPETDYIGRVKEDGELALGGEKTIPFDMEKDIVLNKKTFLPEHSNGMKFSAFDDKGELLLEEVYFSVGGGTVARRDEMAGPNSSQSRKDRLPASPATDRWSCSTLCSATANSTPVRSTWMASRSACATSGRPSPTASCSYRRTGKTTV